VPQATDPASRKIEASLVWPFKVSLIQGSGASAAVLFLGPHMPVAFAAAGTGIGAFAVVDAIGVVIGAADSLKARDLYGNVHNGFKRLIHRRPE
jgi:hypothetical protein